MVNLAVKSKLKKNRFMRKDNGRQHRKRDYTLLQHKTKKKTATPTSCAAVQDPKT